MRAELEWVHMDRYYLEKEVRNINNPDYFVKPTFKKDFYWNTIATNWSVYAKIAARSFNRYGCHSSF